ncbi:MAG: hypothetical protein ACJA2S_005820 [Cyclobacteriaceae bacterium]|jgi:hypothetical protein
MPKRLIRKISFRLCIVALLILGSLSRSHCQSGEVQTKSSSAEKIYLQLSTNVYTTDQAIWFKAILTTAFDHKPSTMSGVLYVELITPNENIIDSKLIKIDAGMGSGFFQLNGNYSAGRYMIRAYTKWNNNFDQDFMFKEYIDVFPSSQLISENQPISKITLTEKNPGQFWLNASLNPLLIDSLHKKKLKVYLTLDGKKDSLSLKKEDGNLYSLDYELKKEVQFATVQMQTENFIDYAKTIALDEDYMDLQFFPEGGELVNSIASKIAFKAIDYKGKGKMISGHIVNDLGDTLASLKSNHLGMGAFILKPHSDRSYYTLVNSPSQMDKKYSLPQVEPVGYSLAVKQSADKIRVTAFSTNLKNDSIYMYVTCRGIAYYRIAGRLKDGEIYSSIPTTTLPEGVVAIMLVDKHNQTVAERLFFNERPDDRLNIKLSTDKDIYSQRDQTTVNAHVSDDVTPMKANISFLTINKNKMGDIQNNRQNILSYFLLDSDLRGKIESPGYYFNESNKQRVKDLDLLLLTQGWRKYHYAKAIDSIFVQPEYSLNLSGSISSSFSKKKKKEGVGLTMMTFGQPPLVQAQTTDSLGRFHFNTNDQYGQNLNILIQSTNKSGEKKGYSIELDELKKPEITFDQSNSISTVDSVINALVKENQKRKQVEDAFRLSSGITYLDEVVIEDYKITPQREKVMKAYGKPNTVIDGKAILEQEEKWSYGLYSVLLFRFPKEIGVRKVTWRRGPYDEVSFLYASINKGIKPTLVVVDGIPVKFLDYPLIPNIPPSEVKSFELINSADNFLKLFMEVFPGANPFYAPKSGSVIAIYTHAGRGLIGVHKPKGLLRISIPVFSPPREFYAPKHENLTPRDWVKPDFRSLVHWAPLVETDNHGKASTSFYNADATFHYSRKPYDL